MEQGVSMTYLRLAVVTLLAVGLTWGDLAFEQFTKVSGFMGAGANEITSKVMIKGDRQKAETSSKVAGGSGAGQASQSAITIIRLDKKVMWNFSPTMKTYMEIDISKIKDIAKALTPDKVAKDKTQAKPSIETKMTGEKKTINGFDCERVFFSMRIKVTNPQTGEVGDGVFTNEMWVTDMPRVKAELNDFNKKFAAIIGSEDAGQQMLSAMLGIGEIEYAEFQKKVKEIKGMPILSTMTLEVKPAGKQAAGNTVFSTTNEIKTISTKAILSREFEIPKGFKKQTGDALN